MQVQLQSHGDTVKIGAKLILVRSVLSLKSRFIDSRNHWPGFQTCNEYSSTSNPLSSPFFIWKDPITRNFTISSRIYSLNSFYHYTIFGFSSHSIETLGAVNVYIFRCASISWFQVVTKSVIHLFLQLAHLRVFQIFFRCASISWFQVVSQSVIDVFRISIGEASIYVLAEFVR